MSQSKYPDKMAYQYGPDRNLVAQVTCDFVAGGSGSYFSRACHNMAAFRQGFKSVDGTFYGQSLRCHRHRAIDERTAAKRGWGEREYEPFDAEARLKELKLEAQAKAEAKRLEEISIKVGQCAAYIAAHAVLDGDTVASLDAISAMATLKTLVVR